MRYADDFLIFTKTRIAAERVFRSVERYLTSKLKIGIGAALLRTPATPPSMRIRTRRFASWKQALSMPSID